jgi:hypothetical protein
MSWRSRAPPGVQAKAMAPECEAGARLRAAAAALPLVLMVDKDSPYRDVMRGIELGAADVLEKPLSSLKLRNIWQHVVRKVRSTAEAIAGGRGLVSIFSLMHSLSWRLACQGATASAVQATRHASLDACADRARRGPQRMGGGDAFAAPAVKPEVKAVEVLKVSRPLLRFCRGTRPGAR